MDPARPGFEILALTGWSGDRNELAMRGAQAMGRRVAQRTGAPLRELGTPGPAGHLPWPDALTRARPHLSEVAAAVERVVAGGGPALLFANRCAASVATIPAGLRARPDLALLYLDAQADFNTPATTPSQYLGGMVISAVCGLWDAGFGAGLEPRRVVLAGCRDIDPGERALLVQHDVPVHDVAGIDAIVERLRGRAVWLHLDLDVIEPGVIPTEYRVPGGPSPDEVRALLAAVAGACDVVALEVAEYELGDAPGPEEAIEHVIAPVLASWARSAPALSRAAQTIQDVLIRKGLPTRVVELSSSARTADAAAQAIGCAVAQIVKSLVFRTRDTGTPILVLASGANRVDEKAIAAHVGEKIAKADADFVRETTGFAIGGIPPVGHKQAIRTFIDQDLLAHAELWAAAGTPHAVFCVPSAALEALTGGKVISIA